MPLPWHRRHRRLLLSVLLICAVAIGWAGGRPAWNRLQLYRQQRQQRLNEQLVVASFKGDVAAVRRSLSAGADPDGRYGKDGQAAFQGRDGGWPLAAPHWTPLIALASSDYAADPVTVAKLLVAAHANLDLHDGFGATALNEAVYLGREDLALYLLSVGADPNSRVGVYIDGIGGITTLHRAVGSPRLVAALLKSGVKVNVADGSGQTPLHWAVRETNVASVKLLLEAGADPHIKDREGLTPLSQVQWSRERVGRYANGEKANLSPEEISQLVQSLNEKRSNPEKDIANLLKDAGVRK